MPRAVGIDLGTTNSVIAAVSGGRPSVIPNVVGSRTTPSVVAFTDTGAQPVGDIARRQMMLNPRRTIYSVKRFTGRRFAEVDREAAAVTFDVVDDNGLACFDVNGRWYAPEEINALVLRALVADATAALGEPVTRAVITVPAYFNAAQRTATRQAGRLAGLDVLRIIDEPTAAALAYGLDRAERETVLVVDLGGGTFDVSVLAVGGGVVEVRAVAGDTRLGGDDFDHRLAGHLAEEFQRRHGIDPRADPLFRQRLVEAAERAKVEMSAVTETEVSVPFTTVGEAGDRHLRVGVNRSTFDRLTGDLIERCRGPIERAMHDAGVTSTGLDQVLMVGGSTRIPAVRELLRRLVGGLEPNLMINADEVVALGAAIQAGVLTGVGTDVQRRDITPLTRGPQTHAGLMATVLERDTATISARDSDSGESGPPAQRPEIRSVLARCADEVERDLDERGDAAPTHERARARMLVDDARGALAEDAPPDRLRTLTAELRQVAEALLAVPGGRNARVPPPSA